MSTGFQSTIDHLRLENERLSNLVYVPGLWRCPKCSFNLMSTNIHVPSGQFSANNEPQQCANGCGPMWRVTERDAGNEMVRRFEAHTTAVRKFLTELAPYLGLEDEIVAPARFIEAAERIRQWCQDKSDECGRLRTSLEMECEITDSLQNQLTELRRAGEGTGWQPMETAPKDGREVLLRVKVRAGIPGRCLVGHYMRGGHCIEDHPPIDGGWYFWTGDLFDREAEPIEWMPLPADRQVEAAAPPQLGDEVALRGEEGWRVFGVHITLSDIEDDLPPMYDLVHSASGRRDMATAEGLTVVRKSSSHART